MCVFIPRLFASYLSIMLKLNLLVCFMFFTSIFAFKVRCNFFDVRMVIKKKSTLWKRQKRGHFRSSITGGVGGEKIKLLGVRGEWEHTRAQFSHNGSLREPKFLCYPRQ